MRLERATAIPIVNASYDKDTYSHSMVRTIASFVAGKRGVSADEAKAWADDLVTHGTHGNYYFCLNRLAFLLSKR